MLRAEQLALIQEANQQLLNIRELELDYFVQCFSDFGTQGALIAGFTLSALTQVDAINADVSDVWKWIFWLSCAFVMATSLHCMLTTTFINIFGPGLALRGPAGSMVRAVDGMLKEKNAIFMSFLLSVVFFQISTFAVGFIVMDEAAAWCSAVIIAIGGYCWYHYCLRIYNRFKLDKDQVAWNDPEDHGPGATKSPMYTSEPVAASASATTSGAKLTKEKSFMSDDTASQATYRVENTTAASGSAVSGGKKKGVMSKLMKKKGDKKSALSAPMMEGEEYVRMEGYLAKRGASGAMFSDPWNRRYFVLEGSDLYYYKSREDFNLDPSKSIKNRPISVAGYAVSTTDTGGPLQITLTPVDEDDDRRVWEFRCDTEEELRAWKSAFQSAGACQVETGEY